MGQGKGDEKPKMKSLLPGMTPADVTLEQALRLLSLPREVGVDPETGETVVADYGRYGPYLKRGTETRSLDRPDDVFEVGLDLALQKLREPKPSRRRGPTALKDLGADPVGNTVKLMAGRYGPYVTDGTTNASLPRGADPAAVTIESALELLEARRRAGPRPKQAPRRKAAATKKSKAAKRPRKTT
jgi:DNA topoisomerase-1